MSALRSFLSVSVSALSLASLIAITGCSAVDSQQAPSVRSSESADSDASTQVAFPDAQDGRYDIVPEPGRTISAAEAEAARELSGFEIVAIVPDASATSLLLAEALAKEAQHVGAEFELVSVGDDGVATTAAAFDAAAQRHPDLVVGLGAPMADDFSFETAQLLDQQFLLLGAQVPEPTGNMTAVIWDGATSRGSAVAPDGELDAASTTPDVAAAAARAGLGAVAHGPTGVVVDLNAQ